MERVGACRKIFGLCRVTQGKYMVGGVTIKQLEKKVKRCFSVGKKSEHANEVHSMYYVAELHNSSPLLFRKRQDNY